MPTAYIALGSNLGNPEATLRAALTHLDTLPDSKLLAASSFHQTAPVGGPPGQPQYLNAAAALQTAHSPETVLNYLLAIERNFGRDRAHEIRHGPRILDLDVLLYDQQVIDGPGLTIPHPRMHDRRFVLAPLVEIAPDVVHPVLHLTIAQLLDKIF